jgi:ATP-dependent helicase HrpB
LSLPIDASLPAILESLRTTPRLVLEAPPGAGKTTRLPRALQASGLVGDAEVLVSEPRRIAARLSAERVAEELGQAVGRLVGYRVRFEDVAGPETRICYLTEGVLLRRLLADPGLTGVGAVVLDEFHERHLETDLLLALLLELQRTRRPELRLVVMSATLDGERVAELVGDCPRHSSEGRRFPVSIEHAPKPDERPLEKQVVSAVRSAINEGPLGDILVFLPGALEIRRASEALSALASEHDLVLAPLHGDLPVAEQAKALRAGPKRRVVLSTNVAESSVTIDGVSTVVDSGLARVAEYSPWTGLARLTTAKVSRASATQRAGRAGRQRAGRVLRLYTKGDFESRPEHDLPELVRRELGEAVLLLRGFGLRFETLRFLDPPPAAALQKAEELLSLLGASDESGDLTAIGRRLLELPLHPRLGRIVVEGERLGVAERAVLVAAFLGERDPRLTERVDFGARRGKSQTPTGPSDVLELCDVYELARSLGRDPRRLRSHDLDARVVETVFRAERKLLSGLRRNEGRSRGGAAEPVASPRPETEADPERALLLSVLAGFADRLARRRKPGQLELLLASGSTARLSDNSVVRDAELLVAVDLDERSGPGGSTVIVRLASSVRAEWLFDLYSERITLSDDLSWNETSERVDRATRLSFGAVVLEEQIAAAEPSEAASAVLSRAVTQRGTQEFLKGDALIALRERLLLVARFHPELELSNLDEAFVLELVRSLCFGRVSFAELRAADPARVAADSLAPAVRRLVEQECPEQVLLPGGRRVAVHYEPGRPPYIESRLQDFFGMGDGPRLCGGRLPLTLHLLAPNARAVQVTQDLAGFWERHYPTIRRELMRRYPRHSWPEDGRHAAPPPPKPPRR